MKSKCYIQKNSSYSLILIFFIMITLVVNAQEKASISGIVVNENGVPVVNIKVEIRPLKAKVGGIKEEKFIPHLVQHTDIDGCFTITNIPPETAKFIISGDDTITKLKSIDLGDLTLFPDQIPTFPSLYFSLDPGAKIENVIIKVKNKIIPHIRARVIAHDGTPVRNSHINTAINRNHIDMSRSGGSRGYTRTDSDGYFTEKLKVHNEPQYYRIGIEHHGYFAVSDPFIPHDGQPLVHLLLKLNDKPIPFDDNTPERVSAEFYKLLSPPSVWILNPINGHHYKRIYCYSMKDALNQSYKEKAYLISINDKNEEKWLKNITGRSEYIIGLRFTVEEGKWKWLSGEPVNYTNWGDEEQRNKNNDTQNYVIISSNGKWYNRDPNQHRGLPLIAILEKEVPNAKTITRVTAEVKSTTETVEQQSVITETATDAKVPVSPNGFGPYPDIPEEMGIPKDKVKIFWENMSTNPEHELLARVRVKLYQQGIKAEGATYQRNGLIYPIIKGVCYVEWDTRERPDGSVERYVTSFTGHPEDNFMRGAEKPVLEVDIPKHIKIYTYPDGGIDPYDFLNLPKE